MLEQLRDALDGTQRINTITRSLGTFSRVEDPVVCPVNIQSCMEHAATMGFNELKYRARLVKDYGAVAPVLASEGKLAQVFLNLLINAAHAIPEGRVAQNEIRVRTWCEGDSVFGEVSDTGKGIAPEHMDFIFEPFFTTKGPGVGSGLGLSICKSIVSGFGGDITCSSEPGKGSRFVVRLPRMSRPPEVHTAVASERTVPRSPTRGRILVIDDEVAIRTAIMRMLRNDHDVVVAASGEEGRSVLEQDRTFDLIFCDLMMPTLSGMDLHVWLTLQDPSLAQRMVFMTGGAFTPGASEYLAKAGNPRMDKPFDPPSFRRTTAELVRAARRTQGA